MNNQDRLTAIRESERKSHIEMYSNEKLYQEGSWLTKPIKTVLDILPLFEGYKSLNVLDLGSGIGRNSIAIARHFQEKDCLVECVDILDIAITKLIEYGKTYGIENKLTGIVQPIEEFEITENKYDWIMAVSALEHVDSKESFCNKLMEISNGIKKDGVVCLVVNSNIREKDKETGEPLPPQFEVNLGTEEMQEILMKVFNGWEIIKSTVSNQRYDIPRESRVSDLKTCVVTLVARKK